MPHGPIGRKRILRDGRRSSNVTQLQVRRTPDGKVLAVGCRENAVKIWDLGSGKELRHFPELPAAVVSAVVR